MTKQIKNWREKAKQKRYEQDLINRLETIMFNLSNDLTTEESIRLFKDVDSLFLHKMQERLSYAEEEEVRIKNFLK